MITTRMMQLLVLLFTVSGAIAQPPATGTISGTIRYTGEVPPSQKIMTVDGVTFLHNDVVVNAKTKGLRDVFVMVNWSTKHPADPKAKPVTIDQRDMRFWPRVVTVQEGRAVRFENNDTCNHAVDAKSVITENNFNVSTPIGRPFDFKFKTQKNPIPIGCGLHPWMRAWVLVAPHPYHAVTDADGRFKIDGMPVGKHRLLLIHPDTNHRDAVSVEVVAGKLAEVKIEWKILKK